MPPSPFLVVLDWTLPSFHRTHTITIMADILSSDDGLPLTSLYINGTYRPASTDATFAVTNSYTGRIVGHSASASSSDCVEAIEAAHRAFPAWESAPLAFRRDVLLRTAAILEGEEWKEKATRALNEETSSTEGWALMNVLSGPGSLRNVAGMVNEVSGQKLFHLCTRWLVLTTSGYTSLKAIPFRL